MVTAGLMYWVCFGDVPSSITIYGGELDLDFQGYTPPVSGDPLRLRIFETDGGGITTDFDTVTCVRDYWVQYH